MKTRIPILLYLVFLTTLQALADEGMWIPMLIEKLNIEDMQEKGFRLTAEDIYSINQASMKDAVMIFGGCTAELISGEGLLITNHHCGYRRIQQHSTVEHDYLTNGFWAMSQAEELPNPGLNARFLKWMDDVTDQVLEGVNTSMTETARMEKISQNIGAIITDAVGDTHFRAHVEPFFAGNQYFLFVEEVFRDVRLVGAPPSAIGKFGGDTDNWMWPRHTGDFSLFRIYAGKDNKPADYDPENVPYQPVQFFPISLRGVQPGDFTMVFGYPGRTYQYVPSDHLRMLTHTIYPRLIQVRDTKLEIMNAAILKEPGVRIQYAAKIASVSNSWKRWIGEIKGLEKLDAIQKKEKFESDFQEWVRSNGKTEFYDILSDYEDLYDGYSKYRLARDYFREVFYSNGTELVAFSGRFAQLIEALEAKQPDEIIAGIAERLSLQADQFFKDYDMATDRALFTALLAMLPNNLGPEFLPSFYINIRSQYQGDFEKYAEDIYEKTFFFKPENVKELLDDPRSSVVKKIQKDPIFAIYESANDLYVHKILPEYDRITTDLQKLDRMYMAAQLDYHSDRILYPDANSTLRLAYGVVKGYEPRDGVYYDYYTTLDGIIEKDNPSIYDYDVPEKLKELYASGDYGRYGQDGRMPVCFIATNHTTGGNSGSPVLNAEGHLIGINFDRAWEGVMSDLMFNPRQCRNISLDIRFALFIIDKFAGASYLLDEMELVE